MALKVIALFTLCAVASGQVYLRPAAYPRPLALARAPLALAPGPLAVSPTPLAVARAPLAREDAEYDPNPQYDYTYSVDDAITGDSKTAQESRSGDTVQGSYSLIEPDGSRRIVEYTADPVNGFNAAVHKEGGVAAPLAVARPPVAVAPAAIGIARAAPIYAPSPVLAPRTIIAPRPVLAPRPILRASSPALISTSFSSPYAQYAL